MSSIALQQPLAAQQLVVRALTRSDAKAFRAIRLKALETDGKYFTASYEDEARRTLSEWADACEETTKKAVFGAFCGSQLVGTMSAITWGKAEAQTVRWGSAFIEPDYRHAGIGGSLYKLREAWSLENGFKQAVFTIRQDNKRSAEIHTKHGAQAIGEEPMRFADGSTARAIWYERKLTA